MIDDPDKARHWRYFLLLESELEHAFRYVEPHSTNYNVFSLEFARQLVAVGAQFETIARLLCKEELPAYRSRNSIHLLREWLDQIIQNLFELEVTFLLTGETLQPFAGWTADSGPPWWTAYNTLKHDPGEHIRSATMRNVLVGTAGLGLLTRMHVRPENEIGIGDSRLFDLSMAWDEP
jgi:hypothetical protein